MKKQHVSILFTKFLYENSKEGGQILGDDIQSFLQKINIKDDLERSAVIKSFIDARLILPVREAGEGRGYYYSVMPELIFSYQDHLEYNQALTTSKEARLIAISSVLIGAIFALLQVLVNFETPKQFLQEFFACI